MASSAPWRRARRRRCPRRAGNRPVEPTPDSAADDEDEVEGGRRDAFGRDAFGRDAFLFLFAFFLVRAPSSAEVSASFATQYNYAASTNGAKVVSSNPEAKSPGAALKEDMDSYYLTPCGAKRREMAHGRSSAEEAAVTAVTHQLRVSLVGRAGV